MSKEQKNQKLRRQADGILGLLFFLCIAFFMAANLFTKDKAISEEENRTLAEKPDFTAGNVLSGRYMDQYESYVSDQFAWRSMWRSLYVTCKETGGSRKENGVFLGKENQLMEDIAAPDEEALEKNIESIRAFADSHADIRTYMLLVPDAAAILTDRLPPYATVENQPALFDGLHKNLAESVQWIDAVSVLQSHAGEKIYYKTDHHWTSLGAYYVFLKTAEAMGLGGNFTNAYDVYPVTTDFNGSLSGKSGFCRNEREGIEVYLPKENAASVLVHYVEDQKKRTSLYDTSKLGTRDPYALFLGGNFSLIDIKTSSTDARRLLLIKDSFANSFLPFLAPFYQEILVVDPRYYAGTIEEITESYAITDALFLYSGNTFFQDHNIHGVFSAE